MPDLTHTAAPTMEAIVGNAIAWTDETLAELDGIDASTTRTEQ